MNLPLPGLLSNPRTLLIMMLLRVPLCSSLDSVTSIEKLKHQALPTLPATLSLRLLQRGNGVRCLPRSLKASEPLSDYHGSYRYFAEADTVTVEAKDCPRPVEIPWGKELCNSVQLIGVVAGPVEVKHFPSGKILAWTRMAVKKSATESFWISLSFWDEMAQVAQKHLVKGNQIYVNGRLTSDVVDGENGKQQTYYKVIVQKFNFIEKSAQTTSSNGLRSGDGNEIGSVEEGWHNFFASPLEWWDNRKTKRTPSYPDFKHKDTGEALWVESRNNPPWVKLQLAKLDEKMRAYNNTDSQWSRVSSVSSDDLRLF